MTRMTEWDIQNYLEKIYKVPVVEVKSVAKCGRLKKAPGKQYLIKDEDYRLAFVKLPSGMKFTFPDLYPEDKMEKRLTEEEKAIEEAKNFAKKEDRIRNRNRRGLPNWFSI